MKRGGHFGEQFGLLLKRVNMVLSDPEFTSRYLRKGSKNVQLWKDLDASLCGSICHRNPRAETTQMPTHWGGAYRRRCPSTRKTTSSDGDGLWGRAQRVKGARCKRPLTAGFCSHQVSKTGPAREAPLRSAVA